MSTSVDLLELPGIPDEVLSNPDEPEKPRSQVIDRTTYIRIAGISPEELADREKNFLEKVVANAALLDLEIPIEEVHLINEDTNVVEVTTT